MKKSWAIILIGTVVLALVVYLFINEYGFNKRFDKEAAIAQINNEIDSTKVEIATLKREIDSLKTSKSTIEHVAREKYNFRSPNEKVLDIEVK
jgi:cell division protein FtsB